MSVVPLVPCDSALLAQLQCELADALKLLRETVDLVDYWHVPTLIVDEFMVGRARASGETGECDSVDEAEVEALRDFLQELALLFHRGSPLPQPPAEAALHQLAESAISQLVGRVLELGTGADVGPTQDRVAVLAPGGVPARAIDALRLLLCDHLRRAISEFVRNGTWPEHRIRLHLRAERTQWVQNVVGEALVLANGEIWISCYGFDRALGLAIDRLLARLPRVRPGGDQRRTRWRTVLAYGVFLHGGGSADGQLESWVRERGLPERLAYPGQPKVLLCVDAIRRLLQSEPPALARAVRTMILIHEHAHAMFRLGSEPYGGRRATHHPAWSKGSRLNEALAEWLELHYARNDPAATAVIREHIESGTYPDWPYRAADVVEVGHQAMFPWGPKNWGPKTWIALLREDPGVAANKFDQLVRENHSTILTAPSAAGP